MRVLLLTEAEYALATRKIAQELSCAKLNVALMRGWEKTHGMRWHSHKWLRKRAIEAIRLERILFR